MMITPDLIEAHNRATQALAAGDERLAQLQRARDEQDSRALQLSDAHDAAIEAVRAQDLARAIDGGPAPDPQLEQDAFRAYELSLVTLKRLEDEVRAQKRLVAREHDDDGYPRGSLYIAVENARRDIARAIEPRIHAEIRESATALARDLREWHKIARTAGAAVPAISDELQKIFFAAGIDPGLYVPSTLGGGGGIPRLSDDELHAYAAQESGNAS